MGDELLRVDRRGGVRPGPDRAVVRDSAGPVSGLLALGTVRLYRRGAPEGGLVGAAIDGLRRVLTDAVAFANAWPVSGATNSPAAPRAWDNVSLILVIGSITGQ
ncbi:hypothetical protein [Krasilnikovia cinnamomea]|uniref:hypothetical protein n=1 Tax=Krasilnikovia cinnamomea TaxID=349313 RepID=UPI00102BC01A|nr:hypothetical protein [Krasilnikovia cinnamomea]